MEAHIFRKSRPGHPGAEYVATFRGAANLLVGVYARLTVRLDVDDAPAPRDTHATATAAATETRAARAPVIVTRPKHEAGTAPINPGDRVAVGLNSYRVLPNYALASERASSVVNVGEK